MEDRWDVINVVCIKGYKTLKVGSSYQIKGRGNLTYNADPEVGGKKGQGYCIEDGMYGSYSGRTDWYRLPYNERIKWYYFTEKEMGDYFITDNENHIIYLRDRKINSIIND